MIEKESPKSELAPISIRPATDSVINGNVPSGANLLFPNGLRTHFGSYTESVLLELLNKSLSAQK